jgi:hypothetical protein
MRSFRVIAFTFIVLVFSGSTSSWAQQQAQDTSWGTVTGHVVCADTQRSARFAQVMLFGVPKEITPPKTGESANPAKALASMMKSMASVNWVQAQTDIEGSYEAMGVAPGDYYVFASVPGYVQSKNMVQAAIDAGADLSKPIDGIPIVHVTAGGVVRADVSIERGAAISGKVSWDDGSPVPRAIVTVLSAKAKTDDFPKEFAMLAVGGGLGEEGRYRSATIWEIFVSRAWRRGSTL